LNKILFNKERFFIMTFLFLKKRARARDVVRHCSISWGSFSTHINALKKAGYVRVRDAITSNGYARMVEITEKGYEEYRRFKRIEDDRVIRVPLEELRVRMSELPKDKEIVIICQIGSRAYEAYRILRGAGFSNVKVMEGGLAFWFW